MIFGFCRLTKVVKRQERSEWLLNMRKGKARGVRKGKKSDEIQGRGEGMVSRGGEERPLMV